MKGVGCQRKGCALKAQGVKVKGIDAKSKDDLRVPEREVRVRGEERDKLLYIRRSRWYNELDGEGEGEASQRAYSCACSRHPREHL